MKGTGMTDRSREVFAGVDTHRDTIHVAVVDALGAELGDREFATTPAGYAEAMDFVTELGQLALIGVEGTGSYGRGLATYLAMHEIPAVEVDRPDRAARRREGKSDPTDAYAAARAAASGRVSGLPKTKAGIAEAIRVTHLARRSAVKARTQTMNQIKALLVTAPPSLREQLRGLAHGELIGRCSRFRADAAALADPYQATKHALRRLACRHQQLSTEIAQADTELDQLTSQAVPGLRALPGVGPDVAAKLIITIGDNPHRMRSEAAFAHLCGAAPIPASSGRTDRHRLNRGGDRQTNNALHTVARSRLQNRCPRTCHYTEHRTQQGLSTRDIVRCLKRFIAREVYPVLLHDLGLHDQTLTP
jgi:transposase